MPKRKTIKQTVEFGKKILDQAKKELNKEREEEYKKTAKTLLEDIESAKRTVDLLEKQLKNFIREIELYN